MRLFVAIEIDKAIRDRIEQTRQQLAGQMNLSKDAVKWVGSENTHLTLVFLGQVDDGRFTEVCRIIETAAGGHHPFDIEVSGLGTFGRPTRVVWAGTADCAELKALWADLQKAFVQAGWPQENREFSGHLTLCRIKNFAAGKELSKKIETMSSERFGRCRVDSVVLFESRLSPAGPSYHPVCRVQLK